MGEKLTPEEKKKKRKKYSKPRIIDQREFERRSLVSCQCKLAGPCPSGGALPS